MFSHGGRVCRLSYLIACDLSWNTLSGLVSGWLDNDSVNIDVSVDAQHRWQVNGEPKSELTGCVDLDLNFSPSTNLLPIRRLNLDVGQHAAVKAAWLRFPSFKFEPLSQVYTRLGEFRYRYSSNGGEFVADLTVDDVGFVTVYPELWEAEQLSE